MRALDTNTTLLRPLTRLRKAAWAVPGAAMAVVLTACPAPEEEAAAKPRPTATATPTPAAAPTGEVVFDPRNPPKGWRMCHRNHCHHEDGRVASYAQVMQEVGATKIIGEPAPKAAPPAPPDVAQAPADAQKSKTGLVSRVVKAGTGKEKPGPNSVVTVHYTGWTADGKSFDSSISRGQPAQFPLGRVMPGWTEGIQLMVVGEERRFWIPQDLSFKDAPGKPTGVVVFDIELISIQ
ncbi:MAG TPA: FKBP-type peptidyl-prolyl cis-trans isomerase [Polyangiaceae bacterium]|nr:FKBP-type peptidyl-prolyl cis-trans isomerase [Polyangiaceae bacterium]